MEQCSIICLPFIIYFAELRLKLQAKGLGTLKVSKTCIKIVKTRQYAELIHSGKTMNEELKDDVDVQDTLANVDNRIVPCTFDKKTCQCTYHCYQRKARGDARRQGKDVSANDIATSADGQDVVIGENGNIDNEFVMSVKNEIAIDDWKWKQKCYYCKVSTF
ncbi:hypothetical protein RFI_27255 [Reticulomyxa filosa]|uniref:Uncharacterized protein n=1 Tax=Reticulomyxa filosa TaxID=46433 RepID=X6M884_RETFI|nr:hypothetical protein RFI_27255 [Reticulomyxa filosa]|eukprot:ETO10124.1 hypothetical protein RFI_27255 [Reticulomyxa filosa]